MPLSPPVRALPHLFLDMGFAESLTILLMQHLISPCLGMTAAGAQWHNRVLIPCASLPGHTLGADTTVQEGALLWERALMNSAHLQGKRGLKGGSAGKPFIVPTGLG